MERGRRRCYTDDYYKEEGSVYFGRRKNSQGSRDRADQASITFADRSGLRYTRDLHNLSQDCVTRHYAFCSELLSFRSTCSRAIRDFAPRLPYFEFSSCYPSSREQESSKKRHFTELSARFRDELRSKWTHAQRNTEVFETLAALTFALTNFLLDTSTCRAKGNGIRKLQLRE